MIALTQEKREELIEDCHDSIGRIERLMNDFPHDAYNLENALIKNKVVLASLTTSALGRVNRGYVSDNNEYPDAKVDCIHPQADWENFQEGKLLFTAPPVPQIKDHQIRELVTEITDTAKKYQGCQCLRDAISKVVIKRLNGLGE